MSSGGGTLLRGAAGGGGAGGGSSSKVGANATSSADGVLTPTVDSPADSEWRSRRGPLDGVGEISGPWEDEDSTGPQPTDLYGKFTWKIENFSEISKRELRSNVFEVGSYKWYILVYPQGCDVHNHLSLFLCVADYDKLLPGWSHFAQFTIAVVNKDPKKSKYSDTLHRFCKKEHDWGWKKFMELSKVLDGFTVADTLVIKAQVQVIHEKPARPFRCLEPQYRRELVRVYLTNVEGICRRFLEEKRETLAKLRDDADKWEAMREFLTSDLGKTQAALATEKADALLKAIVKRFFNEKEVTSTLVMDALYCGCRALDVGAAPGALDHAAKNVKPGRSILLSIAQNKASMCGDLLASLERASTSSLLDLDDESADGEDFGGDAAERDERRLAELGRRTIETYALHHLFTSKVEVSFAEAQAIKMQEALIAEEEEAERVAAEIEGAKKSKKAKQKQRKKDKKEAEEAELAARLAEEEAEKAKARAAAEAEAAEARRVEEARLAAARAEEEAALEEAAREARAKAAAEAKKAAEEKAARDAEAAAARAAAQAARAAAQTARAASSEGDSGSGSGDDAEMMSATGSIPGEQSENSDDERRSPGESQGGLSPDAKSRERLSAPASPAEANKPNKPIPAPRPPGGVGGSPGASESPGRANASATATADGFEETGGKRSKKAAAKLAAAEASASKGKDGVPSSPGKKALPSPRANEQRGASSSPAPASLALSPADAARLLAGDGAMGAVEAAALRAHCHHLEAENARLRRELAELEHASGGRRGERPNVARGTPPASPARQSSLDADARAMLNGAGFARALELGAGPPGSARGPPPGRGPGPERMDGGMPMRAGDKKMHHPSGAVNAAANGGPPPPPGPPPPGARAPRRRSRRARPPGWTRATAAAAAAAAGEVRRLRLACRRRRRRRAGLPPAGARAATRGPRATPWMSSTASRSGARWAARPGHTRAPREDASRGARRLAGAGPPAPRRRRRACRPCPPGARPGCRRRPGRWGPPVRGRGGTARTRRPPRGSRMISNTSA